MIAYPTRDEIHSWEDIKAREPKLAVSFESLIKETASEHDIPWYDDEVEYVGSAPGLERLLHEDARGLELDGRWFLELNPSGQIYNPGPSYFKCESLKETWVIKRLDYAHMPWAVQELFDED